VGVLEQRLGRNAAPEQARAAERLLFLDNGDFQSELCGADRRDVAPGSGADDHDVIFLCHNGVSTVLEERVVRQGAGHRFIV
jgi:hypothetical protein